MTFEFEINDDVVQSVQSWISLQLTVYPDPATGLPVHQMQFEDVHDFFEKALLGSCQQACFQFPSPALRAQLVAKKQAEDAFAAAIKPMANRSAGLVAKPQ